MDADTNQLPVWTIQGTNWIAEVPLDEHNAQFDNTTQAHEAATRLIEFFKNPEAKRGIQIQFINGKEVPELGGVVMAYPVGTNPHDAMLLYVHELLANGGFYKDSFLVQTMTDELLRQQDEIVEKAMTILKKDEKKPKAKKNKKPRKPAKKKTKPKKPKK